MSATQVRGTVRSALKAHACRAEMGGRASNPKLEALITKVAREMIVFYNEEDRAGWKDLPKWCTDAVLEHFCHPVRVAMGDNREQTERPDLPGLPEKKARKNDFARGFDLFCWLQKEKCETMAKKLATTKKWATKTRAALLKIAGSRLWGQLKPVEKKLSQ